MLNVELNIKLLEIFPAELKKNYPKSKYKEQKQFEEYMKIIHSTNYIYLFEIVW